MSDSWHSASQLHCVIVRTHTHTHTHTHTRARARARAHMHTHTGLANGAFVSFHSCRAAKLGRAANNYLARSAHTHTRLCAPPGVKARVACPLAGTDRVPLPRDLPFGSTVPLIRVSPRLDWVPPLASHRVPPVGPVTRNGPQDRHYNWVIGFLCLFFGVTTVVVVSTYHPYRVAR